MGTSIGGGYFRLNAPCNLLQKSVTKAGSELKPAQWVQVFFTQVQVFFIDHVEEKGLIQSQVDPR